MRALQEKRNIPSTPIHFHVCIGDDIHTFKVPYYTTIHKLKDMEVWCYEFSRLSQQIQVADSDDDIIRLTSQLAKNMDNFLPALGAFIGLYWFHSERDLETQLSDYSDIHEYGSAVSHELHDAGYDESDVIFLGTQCAKNYFDRQKQQRHDVEGKKRFFVHPPV